MQALHPLIHCADAKTLVRSFVQLLDSLPAQDEPNFRCAFLNDDDRVELKIISPGYAEPTVCVQVPRFGNFRIEADANNDQQAHLVFGDADDPLIVLGVPMTDDLRDALRFERKRSIHTVFS
ncbi:hypothetical protein [Pandoraea sputorum]|uniref:Uncharacterized protein n=1 Tax=Pandoraea sputorum TaxID=93222 RepID=A0A5E5BJL6_9BURK|nr:hypothetical protein [Pandoraea sputorum]VVE86059.1 hypothetical protein PSP31121_05698 [Pandoraea sputorum]